MPRSQRIALVVCLLALAAGIAHAVPAFTPATQGNAFYGAVNVTTAAAIKVATTGVTQDRKNIAIQNNGPNAIWCGFDSSVSNTTGTKVAASGGAFAADYGSATTVWCRADTADQTSPNNTRVLEAK